MLEGKVRAKQEGQEESIKKEICFLSLKSSSFDMMTLIMRYKCLVPTKGNCSHDENGVRIFRTCNVSSGLFNPR